MAYKLIWSPASRDDLRDIVTFISRDSAPRAETFAYRLIAETDKLQDFSELGRVVPEYRVRTIREIIVRSYRIVYRVDRERKLVEIRGRAQHCRAPTKLPNQARACASRRPSEAALAFAAAGNRVRRQDSSA